MGFNISYKEHNEDSLEVYLTSIISDSEKLEKSMLEASADKVKEKIVANLNKHRRSIEKRYKNRPAMADDVKKTRIQAGTIKITGGKKTGTLWHLVNDGNLYSQPTHFMDDALNNLDNKIDEVWKEAER